MTSPRPRHIAIQFGHVKHFNEGLGELARQHATHLARMAPVLQDERGWRFHFFLPDNLHGYFGDEVIYHSLGDHLRFKHRSEVDFDVWHGLHHHMRYRPPVNSRFNIITVPDLNHLYAKRGLSLWWQNFRLRRHLRHAQLLTTISGYVKDDIRRNIPGAPPIEVVYCGVADLRNIEPVAIPELVNFAYFFHVSRMSRSKNVEAIIELARIWPEKRFVLAGAEGPDVDRHRAAAHAAQLTNVQFITNISEGQKAWLYANCEAFLFPSLMEGFGLPPVEAMSFNKPVCTSKHTSLPEVCGEVAFYWDSFDPHHMKNVVTRAMQSPEQYMQGAKWTARYTWSQSAHNYCDLYSRNVN